VQSLSWPASWHRGPLWPAAPNSAGTGQRLAQDRHLRDVTGVAGYVHAANGGKRYAVIAFVNHEQAPAGRPAIDALIDWVAALPN
jgi:serine-type D-Ala-D-Ala carboxypeptidase/endopeptidase (penicillin-binding protein 4)